MIKIVGRPYFGTCLEESSSHSSFCAISRAIGWATLALPLSFSLLACGPRGDRLTETDISSPESTQLLGFPQGKKRTELAGADLPTAQPTLDPVLSSGVPSNEVFHGTQLEKSNKLQAFAVTEEGKKRIALILGWMEFYRSSAVLPFLKKSIQPLNGALDSNGLKLTDDDVNSDLENKIEELGISSLEFHLWRALLRPAFVDSTSSLKNLDVLALRLASASQPDHLDEIDRLFPMGNEQHQPPQ